MGAGRIDTSGIVGKQRFPATLARRAGALTGALLAASVAFNAADAATSSEFWRSRGYGLVATVVNGKSAFYDVTQTTCVAQKIYDSAGIFDHATWSAGRLRATVISPWGLTIWQFDRIAALPAPCVARAPDADSPVYNFEVFWKTFDEQYAYLKQRGVDWKVIGENYRAKVTTLTTDAELLEVFRSMLRQLQDRHTMIIAGAARINDAIPDPIAQWYADFDRAPTGDRDDVTKNKLVEYLSPSWKRYLDPDSIRRVSSNVTTATTHDGRVGYLSIAAES